MDVHLRTAVEADREAITRLAMRAFSATPGEVPDANRPMVDDDRRIVAEVDGRLVGHLGAWPLGHFLAGRSVATAGISAVVVAPEVRGRGVGGRLMQAGLAAARDRGEPLASLFPLTRHLYRRQGFELAGTYPDVELDTAALAALPAAPDVEVVPGSVDDVDAMLALEREVAAGEAGMLDRPKTFALRSLKPGEHDAVALARRDGELTGYVVYGHQRSDEPGALYGLAVRELVARDADTLRTLWRVLGSSASAARTVETVVAPEDPLDLWLPERAWRNAPYTWRWMARLVDAAAAVAARGWPAHVAGTCHLDVDDPTWPDHGGAWVLEVADGSASLTRGGRGEVAVDVGALASWFTGYQSATRLVQAGRLRGGDAATLAFLDAATAGPTPWVRTFF